MFIEKAWKESKRNIGKTHKYIIIYQQTIYKNSEIHKILKKSKVLLSISKLCILLIFFFNETHLYTTFWLAFILQFWRKSGYCL